MSKTALRDNSNLNKNAWQKQTYKTPRPPLPREKRNPQLNEQMNKQTITIATTTKKQQQQQTNKKKQNKTKQKKTTKQKPKLMMDKSETN